MKIFYDKFNINKYSSLKNSIDIDKIDRNLELHLEKNEIYLINKNYKKPVKIIVDFNGQDFIERINMRLKDNKDIFHKIFSNKNSSILDGTAGFGRDGTLLNAMGHNVTMIESSPLVSLLLKNGIERSHNKIRLFHGNVSDFLKHSKERYDYIYLDFMFNKLKINSLASKYDETLKLIAFADDKKKEIVEIAKEYCKKKVVVKEPRNSTSSLSKPNHIIKTKLISFNIYLSHDK
jgi:16S rRNA (guanine1516-N2)-methyltransferase